MLNYAKICKSTIFVTNYTEQHTLYIHTLRKKCSSRTFSPLTSTLPVMYWKVPLN